LEDAPHRKGIELELAAAEGGDKNKSVLKGGRDREPMDNTELILEFQARREGQTRQRHKHRGKLTRRRGEGRRQPTGEMADAGEATARAATTGAGRGSAP